MVEEATAGSASAAVVEPSAVDADIENQQPEEASRSRPRRSRSRCFIMNRRGKRTNNQTRIFLLVVVFCFVMGVASYLATNASALTFLVGMSVLSVSWMILLGIYCSSTATTDMILQEPQPIMTPIGTTRSAPTTRTIGRQQQAERSADQTSSRRPTTSNDNSNDNSRCHMSRKLVLEALFPTNDVQQVQKETSSDYEKGHQTSTDDDDDDDESSMSSSSSERSSVPQDEENGIEDLPQQENDDDTMEETQQQNHASTSSSSNPCVECTICLNPIEPNAEVDSLLSATSCDHVYHRSCIMKWFLQHSTNNHCPNCRKQMFTKSQYEEMEKACLVKSRGEYMTTVLYA